MHTGQMIERVLDIVGDPEGVRFGVGLILGLLEEAQRDIIRDRRIIARRTATLTVDATQDPDTAFFTLPSDCVMLEQVKLNGVELTPITLTEVTRLFGEEWETETGTPYYVMKGYWGNELVRLVPDPAEAASPTAYFQTKGSSLGSNGEPIVSELYHMAMVHYAAGWIFSNHGEARDEQAASVQHQQYLRIVGQASTDFAKNGIATPHISIPRRRC